MTDLRILWVLGPGVRLATEPDLDTTRGMVAELARREIPQDITTLDALVAGRSIAALVAPACLPGPASATGYAPPPAERGRAGDADLGDLLNRELVDLDAYDLIIQRVDPPLDAASVQGLQILAMHEARHRTTRYVNSPTQRLLGTSKLLWHRIASTRPGFDWTVGHAVSTLDPDDQPRLFVTKPLDACSGGGVERHPSRAEAERHLRRPPRGYRVVAPFRPAIVDGGEVRNLFFGATLLAAWTKLPADGSFRTNLDAGARIAPASPGPARDLACTIAADVVDLCGPCSFFSVDLAGDDLIEIQFDNVGGVPQAEAALGTSIVPAIVDHVLLSVLEGASA